jgi:hypothetical protein
LPGIPDNRRMSSAKPLILSHSTTLSDGESNTNTAASVAIDSSSSLDPTSADIVNTAILTQANATEPILTKQTSTQSLLSETGSAVYNVKTSTGPVLAGAVGEAALHAVHSRSLPPLVSHTTRALALTSSWIVAARVIAHVPYKCLLNYFIEVYNVSLHL